jgi:ABC-2 type transport system ATP-binding protein
LVEEPAFWSYLTGRRNLEYYARAAGPADDRRRRLARVEEVLATVDLSSAAGQRVKAYSQGMRQRLGIARALLGDPDLLVLDEPTNGLDPEGMRAVRRLLRALADAGTTVFVSSHLLGEVEAMCDRVAVLARGRLVAEGPPGGLPTLGSGAAGGPGAATAAATRVRVEVAVGDRSRALAILGRFHGVALEPDGGGALRLRLPAAVCAAQVNAALVDGGVAVHALVPERQRLEDVYLELVAGAEPPQPG